MKDDVSKLLDTLGENLEKIRADLLEFATLVRDMREAQIKYFKTRSSDVLFEAKRLEKLVDASLAAPAVQQALFKA